MNNLFNMFKKILPGKEAERKIKEEEDPNGEANFTFEVNPIKSLDVMNYIVKDLKIGGVSIDSYEAFNKALEKLFAQYKGSVREIDYRYSKLCEKEETMVDISKYIINDQILIRY